MTIKFDESKNMWVVSDMSELQPNHMINMLEWGQPYSPYESNFNHDVYNNGYGIPPILGLSNQNAMINFEQNVDLNMFDVVQKCTSGTHNLLDGTCSFDDLVNMGIANDGIHGDHRISTNLYGTGDFYINDGL